jgi:N-acyl-D-aspartate/D-glutamate deacylase
VREALDVGRRSGVRVQISHCKAAGARNHGRGPELLRMLHEARAAGVDVYGDQYPYATGESFLSALLPASMHEGGSERLRERLADPSARARAHEAALSGGAGAGAWHQTSPDGIMVSMHADAALRGLSIAQLAADRDADAWDVLCEIVRADPSAMMVYRLMDDGDVEAILADPLIAIGSDNSVPVGLAHQRAWGCFPTVLGEFVREREIVTLEEAVRKMTSLPARQFGLSGRGYLGSGAIADLVVFDAASVGHPGRPTEPWVEPTGIPYVVLAGEIAIDDGRFSGRRGGRVLRAGRGEPSSRRVHDASAPAPR